jgi:hypothetical protein
MDRYKVIVTVTRTEEVLVDVDLKVDKGTVLRQIERAVAEKIGESDSAVIVDWDCLGEESNVPRL